MTRPALRIALLVLGGLAALLLLVLAAWMAVAGPTTVARVVRYGDTQIDDYLHYPARTMLPSPSPHAFDAAPDRADRPLIVPAPGGGETDLDALLLANDTITLLVLQNDRLVVERYYQGHAAQSLSQSFSMAKSFSSALVGLAIADGLIPSVEAPITDYIPELAPHGFQGVTIAHLLTMTSGSAYVENDNPFGIHVILNYTPDLEGRILSFRMADEPGAVWRYKSGDNALLGLLLSRVLAPRTISEYMAERIWAPLGMASEGLWSLDHAGDGLEKTWCCLAATPPDYLRLGRLYLHEGVWDGRRVLPEGWVHESTRVGRIPEAGWDADYRRIGVWNYGYQWWLLDEAEGSYLANGKDGQYLYVNPATETVILRLGWSMGDLPLSRWLALFRHLESTL
jgi:CubicO group peptidase (beta-lactamase class C family)